MYGQRFIPMQVDNECAKLEETQRQFSRDEKKSEIKRGKKRWK